MRKEGRDLKQGHVDARVPHEPSCVCVCVCVCVRACVRSYVLVCLRACVRVRTRVCEERVCEHAHGVKQRAVGRSMLVRACQYARLFNNSKLLRGGRGRSEGEIAAEERQSGD
jgi:hypothetical protein